MRLGGGGRIPLYVDGEEIGTEARGKAFHVLTGFYE